MRITILGFLAWLISCSPALAGEYNLTVQLHGIKNSTGQIHVELYSDPKTFRKSALAQHVIKVEAKEDLVTVKFSGIKPGVYAILAFHDEDGNGVLNKRFGMIPTEGYALSNDPDVFGPPAFTDSKFEVVSDQELDIPIHYK
jgi:uncharacterized protein (DUF2141 family)